MSLIANPGPDGVSLREALEVTNNDPGDYSVRFAQHLAGATIEVGAGDELPRLAGGSVFVNGDVDADGDADVRVLNVRPHAPGAFAFGFRISSSGNRLHALVLENFSIAVFFQPVSANTTFANNQLSALVLERVHAEAIAQNSSFGTSQTNNRWTNTKILGNTIESQGGGIAFFLGWQSVGDALENLTIAGNTIRIRDGGGSGISVNSGGERGSRNNTVSDVLIANNSVEGSPAAAIGMASGSVGASANTIERVRIVQNRIRLDSSSAQDGSFKVAMGFGTGDGATDHVEPNAPIEYPEHNLLRNVEVKGNVVTGESVTIAFSAGCCGAASNSIADIRVEDNTLRGQTRGDNAAIVFSPGGSGGYYSRSSADNHISDVSVSGNSITLLTDQALTGGFVAGSGVLLSGGGGRAGRVEDVSVRQNCIDTRLIGISLVGGFGEPQATSVANLISRVELRDNLVTRPPTLLTPLLPELRGINLAGGVQAATGNRVACVAVSGNSVAGLPDALSSIDNIGAGASGNVATTGGC